MKPFKSIFLWGFITLFLTSSCEDKVKWTESYMANVPVYLSFSEFRQDKTVSPARELSKPGKICMYGNYLLINEISEGIHIIDNSNPASPQNVGFLEIIGNIDLAIKDNLLFADSYTDLVCFDITNPRQPVAKSRTADVFPYAIPPTENQYPVDQIDWDKGVIIGWEVKKVTRDKQKQYPIVCYDYASDVATWSAMEAGSKATSLTGSMARYAVNGNYLYVISTYSVLKTFSIENNKAVLIKTDYLPTSSETIFYSNQCLFIGGPSGLSIYSVENPASPQYKSSVRHVLGCDPVVVQGDYAFLTIRGGNFCGQNSNLLEVVNISDIQNPVIAASFQMTEPYGLGIDGNTLFVCDKGLKVFDATDPLKVGNKPLSRFESMHGFDLIAYNKLLMLIGNDGLFQYDYSDINNIRLLSSISIKK